MKKFLSTLAFSFGLAGVVYADATVVFNEIHYHPATNEPALEWVELRNQLAVDVDLSEWSITGDVGFVFPSNAIVRGGGFVLVALSPATMMNLTGSTNVWGPFTNRLGNNGGTLRLKNNAGRLVNELNYGTDGDWPVAPDGSGVTLAKRDRDTASGPAANWTWSEQIGGTPGAENFAVPGAVFPDTLRVAVDTSWKYEASGANLGTAWREPGYNDTAWASRANLTNRVIPGLFNTGVGNNGLALANNTPDTHYILTANANGGTGTNALSILNHPAWLANNSTNTFIGVLNPGNTTINGGSYNFQTTFSLAGFLPASARLNLNVAVDNDLTDVFINGSGSGLAHSGFAALSPLLVVSSGFVAGVNTLEFRTVNQGAGPGGFLAAVNGTALAANTNSPLPLGPTTYYFRKSFTFSGDPAYTQLRLNSVVTDGAVVYLNGVEVYRQNMPAGAVTSATSALSDVAAPNYSGLILIPSASLLVGANVLAVEVHQAAGSADGPLYGADLFSTPLPVPAAGVTAVSFNEQSASTNAEFWLELHNFGTNSYPLGGAVLALDGATNAEFVLPAVTVGPGQFLALTNTTFGFLPSSGERIYLYTPGKARVYAAFVVKKGPRARYPDGSGPWLHPDVPTAGTNNSFAFRNEVVINEIMYHHRSIPGTNSLPALDSPEAWVELYNRGTNPVTLTGWELDGGVRYNFAPGKTIAPGGYLVVADDVAHLRALYPAIDVIGNLRGKLSGRSDRIVLLDPSGNPADEVRYFDSGSWPGYADGGGSSLELRDPWADNSKAEAWAASDETAKTGWQTYTYRSVAVASVTANPDGQWRDFVLGLLAGGECLIDDISVIQSPTSSPVQFISNGNFSSGQTGWRFVGNHNRSRVIPEPGNPGNNVLYLVATGPQEHMHNHIEATFTGANAVGNGNTYDISFRAKHLAANNLLNTRLYFNRCARTTALPVAALNGTPGAANLRATGNIGPTFSQFGHTRVVPPASEAVAVSVVAADPQGVASCEVRYSVNGAAFVAAPMTNTGGGRYLGVIPGQAASAIVQFYVRAVDGLGAAATFPAAGPDGGALYKVNDGQALLSVAHNIRIVMTAANASLMHAPTNVMSNDLLPCTVIVDEKRAYYDAAVRLKSSQRGRNDSSRVGFHLEFAPDDLFRGVHPVMLIDRSNVSSPKGEEILVRHAALRAGVPMPHAELCHVLAPQSAHNGTAIFTPRHEDEFIETAYENGGDGTLFELELIYYPTTADAGGYKLPQPDGVQGLDFSDVGTNKEPYRYNFIIKNHRGEDDYSRFISFARSWSTPAGVTLEPLTRLTTDWDAWMRSYSLVTLFAVSDMYTFGNNHNLLAYQRPSDGKLQYFMWDMDFSLGSGRAFNAALIGDQNLGRILNATPSLQRCFYGYMLDQINTVFNAGYMGYWVDRYDDFAPGASYAANTSRIQQRADYARGQITAIAGNPAFAVNGASSLAISNNNLVTLTGTAPITAKTIKINGRDYAVTWTSISAWTVRIPVEAGISTLEVAGYDLRGNVITNFIRTNTVNYTGVAPVAPGTVVINEIHYNPAIPGAGFLEILNTSTNLAFDLSGWRVNGLDYTFPGGSILTNRGFAVLVADPATYAAAYPASAPALIGGYSGALQNGGETITLLKPGVFPNPETVVDRVRYEGAAPWAADANGLGWSLQIIDAAQDNARVSNWKSSQVTAGGPNDPWRTWVTNFNIGSSPSNVLFMYLDSAGTVDLDEISVIAQAGPTAGIDIVTNGGFEAPLAGTWTAAGVTTNSFITNAVASSGTSALRLVSIGTGGPFATNSFWQSMPLLTNLPYTLRLRYIPTTNANNLTARFNGSARPVLNVQPAALPPPPAQATPGLTNNISTLLPPYDPVWLNELQPENLAGPLDNAGDREPWVELHNAGTNNVDLSTYFLANNYASNLIQWPFPAGYILAPGEFRVVWLDGQTNQTAGTNAHASFRPAAGSGTIALTRLLSGQPQITDYLTYSGLAAGGSYGDFPDGQPFYRQNFFHPTPAATNDNRSAPLVVYINEWMAANTGTLLNQSNNNKYDDWFELYNPGDAPADLGGFWLTDNPSNNFQFQIPAGYTIPARGFLHVWADAAPGLNTPTDPALHVSFKLDQAGDFIGLYGDDGLQVDCATFSQQFNDIAEGRYPDGPAAQWIAPLTIATPAAPNALYGNRYPFLAPLPVQTAYVGQPVTFTAPASDPDAPPQTLAFTLQAGPTNAAVNPATGALLWTPSAAQENSTNTVTFRVSDDGAPVLRAERSYTVIVRTQVILGAITAGPGGAISFTVGTIPGRTYRVEYKDDLNTVPWTTLPPDLLATGASLTINDPIGANPQRFYRVQQRD